MGNRFKPKYSYSIQRKLTLIIKKLVPLLILNEHHLGSFPIFTYYNQL
ncbi:MAG: hypothetical protein JWP44_1873 [Mucilaginibacter sp.]|nr:hypothetical protein [Mucilaginibacter sp.]